MAKKILLITSLILIMFSFCYAEDNLTWGQSGDPECSKLFDDIGWAIEETPAFDFIIYAGESVALDYIESNQLLDYVMLFVKDSDSNEEINKYFSDNFLYKILNDQYGKMIDVYGFTEETKNAIILTATKNLQFFCKSSVNYIRKMQ